MENNPTFKEGVGIGIWPLRKACVMQKKLLKWFLYDNNDDIYELSVVQKKHHFESGIGERKNKYFYGEKDKRADEYRDTYNIHWMMSSGVNEWQMRQTLDGNYEYELLRLQEYDVIIFMVDMMQLKQLKNTAVLQYTCVLYRLGRWYTLVICNRASI